MSLSPGHRLGPYEIVAPIGAGGMGEVYRAHDSRLDRDVAVKVLPREFSENEQLRLRFQREAKTISQLSHPNICTLYDVGHDGGIDFLVMELLEGETLADRLTRGPLPLPEALRIGTQLAEALDRAHRQQIVHRDLKPGNVILSRAGAKLLDFGLAKPAGGSTSGADDATQQKPLTEEGTIVGTFQYMAPEQLEGEEADARTDIFALGVVLYEMVTGRRAFDGRTKMSLIAAIMGSTPEPISSLQPVTPPALEHVVARCLEKSADDRWQSAHDVAEELRWIGQAGSQVGVAVPRSRSRSLVRLLPVLLLGVGLVGGGAMGYREYARRSAVPPEPLRYVIEYGDMTESGPSLSPDGRSIVYIKEGRLFRRDLSRLEAIAIPGTEGGNAATWSPDGSWLAFATRDGIFKIRPDGSSRTQIDSIGFDSMSGGIVWTADGRILFDTAGSGIYEVSEKGGEPRIVVDVGKGEADFHNLVALPDGKGVLFIVHQGDKFNRIDLWDGHTRRKVFESPDQGIDSPVYSTTGHILYWRFTKRGGIWAVPFSIDRLEVTGEPFPVVAGGGQASVSGTTLAHTISGPQATTSQIIEVDRRGSIVRTIGRPMLGLSPSLTLSPDGRRIVLPVVTPRGCDLWMFDTEGGSEPTQLTFGRDDVAISPVWRPDGSEVVYQLMPGGEAVGYRLEALVPGGSARTLWLGGGPVAFHGDTIVFKQHSAGYNFNLWWKKFDDPGEGEPLLEQPGSELMPAISPDGRFIAYDKAGAVMVRTFPDLNGPWPAMQGCGAPKWSLKGDAIFCLAEDAVMEVPVKTARGTVRFGSPERLFALAQAPTNELGGTRLELGHGGDTFLLVKPIDRPPGIVVVHNWLQAIE